MKLAHVLVGGVKLYNFITMIKTIADYFIIFIVSFAGLAHFFRIIYVLFKPKFLEKIKFFSNPPDKTSLLLYYTLVAGVCVYVVYIRWHEM